MTAADAGAARQGNAEQARPVHVYAPADVESILELEKAGAHLLACRSRDEPRPGAPDDPYRAKSPIGNHWQRPESALHGPTLRNTLNDGRLVGLIPGSLGLEIADVDVGGREAVKEIAQLVGAPPVAVVETLREDGYHLVYRSPHAYSPGGYKRGDPGGNRQWATETGQGDLRTNAGFVVAWDPGKLLDAYKQLDDHPPVDLYSLPTPKQIRSLRATGANHAKATKTPEKPASTPHKPRSGGKRALVKIACDAMQGASEGTRNDLLNKLAFGFGGSRLDTSPLREAALASGLPESSVTATIRSGYDSGATSAEPTTLLNVLRSEGFVEGSAPPRRGLAGLLDSGDGDAKKPKPERIRKIGAPELAGEMQDGLRDEHAYASGIGWMTRSDRTHWREDPEGLALCQRVLDRLIAERSSGRVSASLGTSSVCRELRAPLTVPYGVSWDANPEWVGIPGGALLHLPTGHRERARPEYYVSRSLGALPAPGDLSAWLGFLTELLPDDNGESVDWMHRWLGYCMFGSIDRSALFLFLDGPGATGKSTLFDTVRSVLSPNNPNDLGYWNSIPENALSANGHQQHREWLARLEGVRLVTVPDMPAGAWRSGLLKSITSGDPIVANRMYKDSRTFNPQAKFMFAANQKPVLNRADDGLRRRMVIVETRPVSTPDPQLREKLRISLPAITGWMLAGARKYHQQGILPVPRAMERWSADYAEDEDPFLSWWEEYVTLAIGEFVPTRQLELEYQRVTGGRLRIAALMEWLRTRGADEAKLIKRSVQRVQVNGVTVQRRGLLNIALVGEKSGGNAARGDPDGRKGFM